MDPIDPQDPKKNPHSLRPTSVTPPPLPHEVSPDYGIESITPPAVHSSELEPRPKDYGQPWGFWLTSLFGLAIGLILAIVINIVSIPFFAHKIAVTGKNAKGLEAAQKLLEYDGLFMGVMSLVTIPVMIGSCFFFAWLRRKNGITPGTYLALKNPGWKAWIIWPVLWWLSMECVGWVLIKAGAPEVNPWMEEMAQNVTHFWAVIFAVVIGAPLIEEFLFRGFLFSGWQKSMRHLPSFVAITVTVLLTNGIWTMIHGQYDIFGLTAVFSLGILLSVARIVTGSLWVPIYLHFVNNAFAAYAMWDMMNEAKVAG